MVVLDKVLLALGALVLEGNQVAIVPVVLSHDLAVVVSCHVEVVAGIVFHHSGNANLAGDSLPVLNLEDAAFFQTFLLGQFFCNQGSLVRQGQVLAPGSFKMDKAIEIFILAGH